MNMNLEELKTEWQLYDKKIQAVQTVNAKLIEHMIKERSVSRVSLIKRQYQGFFFVLGLEIIVLAAILIGNPFDFKYQFQFIPYVLLSIGIVVALVNLVKLYRKLNDGLSSSSVGIFLKKILEMYEKNRVFEKWFGIIFLSVGFLIPLSFLPGKIENKGWTAALVEISAMMGITLLLYFIALKLGIFKNANKQKFSNDLAELNELKAMAQDLGGDENN